MLPKAGSKRRHNDKDKDKDTKNPRITKIPIHFFWFSRNESNPELPTFTHYSMKSYFDHGYECNLWIYQPDMKNIPSYVQTQDATKVLSQHIFKQIMNNAQGGKVGDIQHKKLAQVSDVFRIALFKKYWGWWSDCDVICLRKYPKPDAKCNGVIMAMCPCKRTGAYAPKRRETQLVYEARKDDKYWEKCDGYDFFTFSVIYADKPNMKIFNKLYTEIMNNYKNVLGRYTGIMDLVKLKMLDEGYAGSIYPTIAFSPLVWFKQTLIGHLNKPTSKGRTIFGTHEPSYSEIMEKSFGIQLYSCNKTIRTAVENSIDNFHPESTIYKILSKLKI